jgi:hypothetical protein
MVPPPWTIISPAGDDNDVEDDNQLKLLAKANGLINSARTNELKAVVGAGNSKPLDQLPRHRRGWQLLQRIQWLVHVDTSEMVPIVGGDASLFIKHFATWCDSNLTGLSAERLNGFLNGGWYWSNSEKVDLGRHRPCRLRLGRGDSGRSRTHLGAV